MNQTIFQKYSETYGTRFSRKQKAKARAALIEDFKELGYEPSLISGRKYLTIVNNLFFGNMKHVKTVIAVPYDTPQRIFWWKSLYYPLDGLTTANKTLLPVFAPILLVYAILLAVLYGMDAFVVDQTNTKAIMIAILLLLILLFYVMLHGIANKKNYCRNSAGIAAAYEIAQSLSKDQRRTTAFLFLDSNKSHHLGAQLAAEDFLKLGKNPNVIVLNTFACGSQMQIGYHTQTKKLAQELSKVCPEPKRFKTVALNDDMRTSSPMEHFAKGVTIGGGEIDQKGRLYFAGSATAKDCKVDEANVDVVIGTLCEYLKKQTKTL